MAKNKNVITIPATRQQFTSAPINEQRKRRVAAYARVSTDHEDQQNSYEAQIDYYTGYITGRDDWEFVKVYADEGITGTSTRHRLGFQEMVADALDGRIDLIVTKSVSRFARNTVDSLTTIRELKDKGVECYFEKENIWTFDGKGELMLTIMSSLAQEEARSISENCTWGQRKRIADGKVSIPFGHFLGFKRGPNGEILVDEEQAVTVRRIYSMFLQGMTPCGIAKQLTADGIKSPRGKDKWSQSTVKSILQNEKYKEEVNMLSLSTLRRKAANVGCRIVKGFQHCGRSVFYDYNGERHSGYMIVDLQGNYILQGIGEVFDFQMSLEDVEEYLKDAYEANGLSW